MLAEEQAGVEAEVEEVALGLVAMLVEVALGLTAERVRRGVALAVVLVAQAKVSAKGKRAAWVVMGKAHWGGGG